MGSRYKNKDDDGNFFVGIGGRIKGRGGGVGVGGRGGRHLLQGGGLQVLDSLYIISIETIRALTGNHFWPVGR